MNGMWCGLEERPSRVAFSAFSGMVDGEGRDAKFAAELVLPRLAPGLHMPGRKRCRPCHESARGRFHCLDLQSADWPGDPESRGDRVRAQAGARALSAAGRC